MDCDGWKIQGEWRKTFGGKGRRVKEGVDQRLTIDGRTSVHTVALPQRCTTPAWCVCVCVCVWVRACVCVRVGVCAGPGSSRGPSRSFFAGRSVCGGKRGPARSVAVVVGYEQPRSTYGVATATGNSPCLSLSLSFSVSGARPISLHVGYVARSRLARLEFAETLTAVSRRRNLWKERVSSGAGPTVLWLRDRDKERAPFGDPTDVRMAGMGDEAKFYADEVRLARITMSI